MNNEIIPVIWCDGVLKILDQRALPADEVYIDCIGVDTVADAIRTLAVRGAPLIGITAAYGMALAASINNDVIYLRNVYNTLVSTRPTAVNLFWALNKSLAIIDNDYDNNIAEKLLKLADDILQAEILSCNLMSKFGSEIMPLEAKVLTHCNTGTLATGGSGTALGVIRQCSNDGKLKKVWVDETRPLLQGARLTAWELSRSGIPYNLICDNMAATLMACGEVNAVVVGADRIAANGDFANKIGTYSLAALAKFHEIPFYVAAPFSTMDLSLSSGKDIPIEFRSDEEIKIIGKYQAAPEDAVGWNPSFDVSPGSLVTGFITEKGVLSPPF
ncbi:MAG: S-methyl-5-thioribose-1-phosphate isomerase [bacterium]